MVAVVVFGFSVMRCQPLRRALGLLFAHFRYGTLLLLLLLS
ncbi:acetyltransferase [Vibrio cholerae]|nr:acetyltransferase [Vibrio cholerae]ELJ8579400.1 acetyltransferase [Vibrio cholerae]